MPLPSRPPWLALIVLAFLLGNCIGGHAVLYLVATGLHNARDPAFEAASYGTLWLIVGVCIGEGRHWLWPAEEDDA